MLLKKLGSGSEPEAGEALARAPKVHAWLQSPCSRRHTVHAVPMKRIQHRVIKYRCPDYSAVLYSCGGHACMRVGGKPLSRVAATVTHHSPGNKRMQTP